MLKSHSCGALRNEHAGQEVTLAGWVHRRRDHGGLVFIDLRDSRGLVQVVFDPDEAPEAIERVHDVRNEFVLGLRGEVAARKPGTENPSLPTGEIEVRVREMEVLNPARTPPFPINEDTEVEELLRLRYRSRDLRGERMQRNLWTRHRTVAFIRRFLSERGFIEVETPILANSTPEGARDYLVPSRTYPGRFYALPQSPQQYKQLLMVAGFERYFQIAHCARDEELFSGLAREVRPDLQVVSPFPRLTYHEAMRRFGSDKPDLRFGMELF